MAETLTAEQRVRALRADALGDGLRWNDMLDESLAAAIRAAEQAARKGAKGALRVAEAALAEAEYQFGSHVGEEDRRAWMAQALDVVRDALNGALTTCICPSVGSVLSCPACGPEEARKLLAERDALRLEVQAARRAALEEAAQAVVADGAQRSPWAWASIIRALAAQKEDGRGE